MRTERIKLNGACKQAMLYLRKPKAHCTHGTAYMTSCLQLSFCSIFFLIVAPRWIAWQPRGLYSLLLNGIRYAYAFQKLASKR